MSKSDPRPATRKPGTHVAGEKTPFGGLTPSEAAQRSHAPESTRGLNKDRSTDSDIVLKLRGKAAKGDVAAARELREWIERGRGQELAGDAWLARLTHEQRAQLRTWIEESEARELAPSRRDREGEDAPAQVTTDDTTDASSEGSASAEGEGDPHPAEGRDS